MRAAMLLAALTGTAAAPPARQAEEQRRLVLRARSLFDDGLKAWRAGWREGAVAARIRTGRLRVLRSACPDLVAEAELYRYPAPQQRHLLGENPIDADNHALAALRYLVSRLDAKFIGRLRTQAGGAPPDRGEAARKEAAEERMKEARRGVIGSDSWHDPDPWQQG
ncbi:MAG: hypothetical protein K2W96_25775 [Gemmataceae bacterium]|nr:hypothetical protein [Gemmataceae bacterium]